jgi:chromodomain-helicase-DNA-binding protein 7
LKNASGKETSDSGIAAPTGIDVGWVSHEKYDMQDNLDKSYRKHLDRHNNKILLRIRLLYYVQHEILSNVIDVINKDQVSVSEVPLIIPTTEVTPAPWWDSEADKSLLIGTYRYGYEQFDLMRIDPHLCFLTRCGPPTSNEEELKIGNKTFDTDDILKLDDDEDSMMSSKAPSEKGNSLKPDDVLDNSLHSEDAKTKGKTPEKANEKDDSNSSDAKNDETKTENDKRKDRGESQEKGSKESPSKDGTKENSSSPNESESEKCGATVNGSVSSGSEQSQFVPFPGPSDLNGRLRRLISSFQREKLKEMARQAAIDKRNERRERIEQVIKEREQQKLELLHKRWNRREEIEFFRTLVAYGVNFNTKANKYDWERFKQLSKLDKKYDDTLTEYYLAFLDMCEKLTGKKRSNKQETFQVTPEPIAEEKANKVLKRLDMFKKLRQEIQTHPNLDERMLLCLDAQDLPEWWIPGKHDRDLLSGVAKHGIIRMEYHILNDQDLSFQDIMKRHLSGESMVNIKEKKLYEEMRSYAAAARKDLVKDENEEVKETKEEKEDKDVVELMTDSKKEEIAVLPTEENNDSENKNDEVKEENQEQKEDKDPIKDKEAIDNDEKDVSKEEIDECKTDTKSKEEPNKDDILKLKKKKMILNL